MPANFRGGEAAEALAILPAEPMGVLALLRGRPEPCERPEIHWPARREQERQGRPWQYLPLPCDDPPQLRRGALSAAGDVRLVHVGGGVGGLGGRRGANTEQPNQE